MTSSQICMLVSIVIYLGGMLYFGFRFSTKNNSAGDFYIGGRGLGPVVTAMSAEASDMSSWLLMGLPGVAYLSGLADAAWTAIGLAAGTYLNWLFVAKRIRCYTAVANDSITVPDFFKNRYRDKSGLLVSLAAIMILVFFIPYTASGFAACGKLFSSLFQMDYTLAMLLSALVIVGYTVLGGFLAASFTDFVQSIVMSAALVVVLVFGIKSAGGIGAVVENAKSLSGYLSLTQTHDAVAGAAQGYGFLTILSTLAWGLGYFGMPHILVQFMAIQDANKLKLSRRIGSIWVVISMTAAVLIGIVGLGVSKAGAIPMLEGSASENVIVRIADLLANHGVAAALLAGVILAGIVAATMSTSDSQLLSAASAVSENLLKGIFKKDLSAKATIRIARITVLAMSAIAVLLAGNPDSSVFKIVSFAWAGFGAAFGPAVLLALFWRRSNKWGALAGMAAGAGMVFLWKFALRPLGGAWNIYELLPAFLISMAVNFAVSLFTKAPEKEITDEFDLVKASIKE